MKTTKSIFAILLTVIMIATIFIGCRNNEESEPVNATANEEITEAVSDEIIENLTEDISVEETKKDENGNTVEINTDSTATNTVTDKDTTTKKAVTTTKKAETTTKKTTTTTKKATTTTKPATKAPTTTKKATTTTKATTTAHTHNYNIPVYAEKQVLVKAAWDEDIYETKTTKVGHRVCVTCGLDFAGYKTAGYTSETGYANAHARKTGHTKTTTKYETVTEKVKTGTKHHDAEYRTEKYVAGYKCSCGAKK